MGKKVVKPLYRETLLDLLLRQVQQSRYSGFLRLVNQEIRCLLTSGLCQAENTGKRKSGMALSNKIIMEK